MDWTSLPVPSYNPSNTLFYVLLCISINFNLSTQIFYMYQQLLIQKTELVGLNTIENIVFIVERDNATVVLNNEWWLKSESLIPKGLERDDCHKIDYNFIAVTDQSLSPNPIGFTFINKCISISFHLTIDIVYDLINKGDYYSWASKRFNFGVEANSIALIP